MRLCHFHTQRTEQYSTQSRYRQVQEAHLWQGGCVKLLGPVLGVILSVESISAVYQAEFLRIRPEIDIFKMAAKIGQNSTPKQPANRLFNVRCRFPCNLGRWIHFRHQKFFSPNGFQDGGQNMTSEGSNFRGQFLWIDGVQTKSCRRDKFIWTLSIKNRRIPTPNLITWRVMMTS